MNKKLFKPLAHHNCYLTSKQFRLFDVIIPKNCVVYCAPKEKTLYFCLKMPRYNGAAKNAILHVLWYDYEAHTIGDTIISNCNISIAMVESWNEACRPHERKIYQGENYEQLMKHDRKKKSQTGGRRLYADASNCVTNSISFNEHTELAHWCYRPASLVASSIRR